ncbi:ExeA family protein [Chromatocurvus halotolerans]|uniref:Type II secretion system protein A n=1 Tax=Chromatocurvus halotolerans TaxID=1132028 RepID=A0A4R2L3N0_9GAMM|nr:AAA family ATPase [Chromatocurvus halotolerans]TCO78416.1 type II secretion system protein A [Chromatocurvus halotolerans]
MYLQYFGLREAPFSIAVNPRYLFMSHRHRDALAHLLYGVGAGGAFVVLTGEVGTGKTTINRCLLEQLPDNTDIAVVLNPALSATELLASVCDELGIDYPSGATTLKMLTDRLHRFLLDNHARGHKTVLLIDEAQHLGVDVLEQIRLLTNLETDSEKLLHIILIGQPELATMLSRPELRQLNQRVTARFNLEPLSREETSAYIRHRLQVAGLAPGTEPFPPAVVRGIYRYSRGVPRVINLLCDRLLLGAYGRRATQVSPRLLRAAVHEVTGEGRAPAAGGRRLGWLIALPAIAAATAALLWWWGVSAGQPADLRAPAGAVMTEARVPVSGSQEVSASEAQSDTVLHDRQHALSALWSLYTDAAMPAAPCRDGNSGSLRCVSAGADTWQELQALGHPLVLDLVSRERQARAALVIALEHDVALLATVNGVEKVDLAALAPLWRGGYRYLWQAPPAFEGVLGPGDAGAAVASVAELFAVLDGQAQPLTTDRYSPQLEQRVRLFQRRHGLNDDGLVGEQTLRQLNRMAGQVPGGEALHARMDALRERGAWPLARSIN